MVIDQIKSKVLDRQCIEELVKLVNVELDTGHGLIKEKIANIDIEIHEVGNRLSRLYDALETGKQLTLDDLVFTSVEGKPIDPCVLTHAFARMAARAGLENVRFHDLRHTFASLMLERGAKPKVISEALGHASVAFTMDVYSHIIEGMQSDAMALLDEVLPPGKNGVKNKINANLTPTVDITSCNN